MSKTEVYGTEKGHLSDRPLTRVTVYQGSATGTFFLSFDGGHHHGRSTAHTTFNLNRTRGTIQLAGTTLHTALRML